MEREDIKNLIMKEFAEFKGELGEHIAQSVQGAVKVTVNGKIDKINEKLDNYIMSDNTWKDEYKTADDTWKEGLKPLMDIYKTASSAQKLLLVISKNAVTLVLGVSAVWAFIKYIVLAALPK